MKLAVLKYMHSNNPQNYPGEWPAEVVELEEKEEGEPYQLPGQDWILMTIEQFQSHKDTHQSSYDTWLSSKTASENTANAQELVKKKIINAMDFGKEVMAEYGSQNILSGKTLEQIQYIMNATSRIQAALLGGSLYVALAEIEALQIDGVVITEDTKIYFRHKIQQYLGVPLT